MSGCNTPADRYDTSHDCTALLEPVRRHAEETGSHESLDSVYVRDSDIAVPCSAVQNAAVSLHQ